MHMDEMRSTLDQLDAALESLAADYRQTGDPTMRFDVVTLKVVQSNMAKRLKNAIELSTRNGAHHAY